MQSSKTDRARRANQPASTFAQRPWLVRAHALWGGYFRKALHVKTTTAAAHTNRKSQKFRGPRNTQARVGSLSRSAVGQSCKSKLCVYRLQHNWRKD